MGKEIRLQTVMLFAIGFLFTIIVPILAYPVNHAITESSLYLTVFLLAVLVEGFIYLRGFLNKTVRRVIYHTNCYLKS